MEGFNHISVVCTQQPILFAGQNKSYTVWGCPTVGVAHCAVVVLCVVNTDLLLVPP